VDNCSIFWFGQHSPVARSTRWDTAWRRRKPRLQLNIADDDTGGDTGGFTRCWHGTETSSAPRAEPTQQPGQSGDVVADEKRRCWSQVSHSNSNFDNVETIALSELAPGAYRLVVSGRDRPSRIRWRGSAASATTTAVSKSQQRPGQRRRSTNHNDSRAGPHDGDCSARADYAGSAYSRGGDADAGGKRESFQSRNLNQTNPTGKGFFTKKARNEPRPGRAALDMSGQPNLLGVKKARSFSAALHFNSESS